MSFHDVSVRIKQRHPSYPKVDWTAAWRTAVVVIVAAGSTQVAIGHALLATASVLCWFVLAPSELAV